MILQQQLPILLSLYWSSFVNLLHDLVYELVLSHAKGHLLFKLQHKFDFSGLEKSCTSYHHELGPGAPATYGVESLVRVLLLKYLYDLSLRELETRLYTDLLHAGLLAMGCLTTCQITLPCSALKPGFARTASGPFLMKSCGRLMQPTRMTSCKSRSGTPTPCMPMPAGRI